MLEAAQRVDDGCTGVLGHALDGALVEGTKDDDVDPAFEIVSDVAEFFARVEAALRLVEEEGDAAHAGHSRFKSEARAQRLLFKKHDQLLPAERVAEIRGSGLHEASEMEQTLSVFGAEIARRNQILRRKLGRREWYGLRVVDQLCIHF